MADVSCHFKELWEIYTTREIITVLTQNYHLIITITSSNYFRIKPRFGLSDKQIVSPNKMILWSTHLSTTCQMGFSPSARIAEIPAFAWILKSALFIVTLYHDLLQILSQSYTCLGQQQSPLHANSMHETITKRFALFISVGQYKWVLNSIYNIRWNGVAM
jgi:hypothetical protein